MTNHDQGSLFPELDSDVDLVAQATERRRITQQIDRVMGPGPVYQGVSKAIRRLTATGKYSNLDQLLDPIQNAGTIAAARAAARAVDKATGHNPTGWHANGRDLAPLIERLEMLMKQLAPTAGGDAFTKWLLDGDAPREESASERTLPAPHPEV